MEELQDKYAESSKKFGKVINKTFSILDLEGVTMSKLNSETFDFIKGIAKVDSANYPESMGLMFIVNAPSMFSMGWGVIQGFLDPRTVSKIQVLGGKTDYLPKLLAYVDEDQLPVELGGKYVGCLSSSKIFKEAVMASGDVVTEEVKVEEGTEVSYRFFCRNNGDVSFEVFFTDSSGKKSSLCPLKAFPAAECSNGKLVDGVVTSPGAGTVACVWTHPNWWSRTVVYRVKIK
uniref:CRAL-TRIO domain-containing protein n=2 Tax=Mucochytrium quahogii TaxID=96639 RepID=A0A7S2RM92_9STRA|mmetsp:Transcript_38505/g.62317  ORF Transcript_38505/g.62317 Transcript_38505/m.62317 type:complete len:232 (-) Transcript_38505:23-718(-)